MVQDVIKIGAQSGSPLFIRTRKLEVVRERKIRAGSKAGTVEGIASSVAYLTRRPEYRTRRNSIMSLCRRCCS